MSPFIVSAVNAQDEKLNFIVEADSHREAWKAARDAARSGRGAKLRDPHTQQLLPWPLQPGEFTVKRVLSASGEKRGRPPKLTTEDLIEAAERQNVRLPPRVTRILHALEAQS